MLSQTELDSVSLLAGQAAALGTRGHLGVLPRCSGRFPPRGPGSPGQRRTKTPAHLVQLQLSQDVLSHSIPDSHHLCKARGRGVRLRARQLPASRQAPRPGRDRCRAPATAQTNTARAAALGSAPVSDCQPSPAPGAGLEQKRGCGKGSGPGLWHLTPRKGWHPRAQDMICQPGGTRGSRGKEQRFSQRMLVQGKGHIYTRGVSSWLMRALWELKDTAQPQGCRTPFFIPEPEPQEVPAPRESWPWMHTHTPPPPSSRGD